MKGEPVKNIEGIKRKIGDTDKRNNTESHLKRAKRKMNFPKDPEEFANAMEDLVHNITPRKREIMKEKNLLNTPTSRKKLKFF